MKATLSVSIHAPISFEDLKTIVEDLRHSGWEVGPFTCSGLNELYFIVTKDFSDSPQDSGDL